MTDFLLFLLPASLAANVVMLKLFFDSDKKLREKEIRIHSLEADLWHYRRKKYRKVVRFLDPQTSMRDKFNEEVQQIQDGGWTFDEELSVNGHMAFYKEEEIKDGFKD